jgi:hypothetical protein
MKTLLVAVIVAILFVPSVTLAYKQVRTVAETSSKPGPGRVTVSKSGTAIII